MIKAWEEEIKDTRLCTKSVSSISLDFIKIVKNETYFSNSFYFIFISWYHKK